MWGGYLRVYEGGRGLEKRVALTVCAKEDENSERATGYLQFKVTRMCESGVEERGCVGGERGWCTLVDELFAE